MADEYQWHLDGWDRQAGRAFATRRSRGADLAESRADWGPTVYIGPPDFRPEQIGSTSIALSAARTAYFAESVPPNANAENELSFPSAGAVAEFVRLAFVGSGRNRGGGGEGGAPPTDRNPPRPPEGERQDEDALWSYFYEAEELRKKLKGTRTVTALPLPSLARTFAHGVREAGIESGALQLVYSLLEARTSGKLDGVWPSAYTTMHRAMVELQIWQEWLQRPNDDRRTIRNARYLWEPVRALIELPADVAFDRDDASGVITVVPYLCSLPYARILPEQVEYARYLLKRSHGANPFYTYAAFGAPPDVFDRFAPMFSWPLPDYIDRKEGGVTNVGGLLMAFIASPARVTSWNGALDIVLFAAALLASRVEDRAAPNWRGRAAANWLAGSVPTHVFSQDIEALIWESAPVREEATASGRN
jgi:hypothetical protein